MVRAFTGGILAAAPSGEGPAAAARVDINRAGVAELCTLPGIGLKRAEAIVLHRVRHGWFSAVAGLAEVDGLGPETVAQLTAHAFAGQPPVADSVR